MKLTIKWNGDETKAKARKAVHDGIAEVVLGQCIATSKTLVRVDTAYLQGSIQARDDSAGDNVKFTWGSFNVDYAIYQEIGPAGGSRVWGYTPYLRPSADENYPKIIPAIKARLQ